MISLKIMMMMIENLYNLKINNNYKKCNKVKKKILKKVMKIVIMMMMMMMKMIIQERERW